MRRRSFPRPNALATSRARGLDMGGRPMVRCGNWRLRRTIIRHGPGTVNLCPPRQTNLLRVVLHLNLARVGALVCKGEL